MIMRVCSILKDKASYNIIEIVKVLEPESSIKLCSPTVELGLIGKDVRFGDFFPDLCIGNLHY